MDFFPIWFTCSFCKKAFPRKSTLTEHKKQSHLEIIRRKRRQLHSMEVSMEVENSSDDDGPVIQFEKTSASTDKNELDPTDLKKNFNNFKTENFMNLTSNVTFWTESIEINQVDFNDDQDDFVDGQSNDVMVDSPQLIQYHDDDDDEIECLNCSNCQKLFSNSIELTEHSKNCSNSAKTQNQNQNLMVLPEIVEKKEEETVLQIYSTNEEKKQSQELDPIEISPVNQQKDSENVVEIELEKDEKMEHSNLREILLKKEETKKEEENLREILLKKEPTKKEEENLREILLKKEETKKEEENLKEIFLEKQVQKEENEKLMEISSENQIMRNENEHIKIQKITLDITPNPKKSVLKKKRQKYKTQKLKGSNSKQLKFLLKNQDCGSDIIKNERQIESKKFKCDDKQCSNLYNWKKSMIKNHLNFDDSSQVHNNKSSLSMDAIEPPKIHTQLKSKEKFLEIPIIEQIPSKCPSVENALKISIDKKSAVQIPWEEKSLKILPSRQRQQQLKNDDAQLLNTNEDNTDEIQLLPVGDCPICKQSFYVVAQFKEHVNLCQFSKNFADLIALQIEMQKIEHEDQFVRFPLPPQTSCSIPISEPVDPYKFDDNDEVNKLICFRCSKSSLKKNGLPHLKTKTKSFGCTLFPKTIGSQMSTNCDGHLNFFF